MTFTLPVPAGFSLRAAADFAREFPGTRTGNDDPDAMSFAWTLDGDWRTASVVLRQRDNEICGEIDGPDTDEFTAVVRRDVERILCLDIDATDFPGLGRHDPVVEALQKRFAGLRPVLFYTAYEAAAWCIIGHRIQMTQAATIKQRLADDYGDRRAFPPPARLGELSSPQRGLTDKKIDQLHHLASAALDGALNRDRLRTQSYNDAEQQLQELPGIGPFSAELILVRGMGAPDALPRHEKRLQAATREAYKLAPNADINPVADHWRPYRSWIALLLRAAQ
jgi:DNA-3-methyladenine glycosylase II